MSSAAVGIGDLRVKYCPFHFRRHRNNVFRIRVDSEYFAHNIGSSFSVPHDTTELVTDTSASTLSSPTGSPPPHRTHSSISRSDSSFRTCGLSENIASAQRTNTEIAACNNYMTSGVPRANNVVSSDITRSDSASSGESHANGACSGDTHASDSCAGVTRTNEASSSEARASVASSSETRTSGACSGVTRANDASYDEMFTGVGCSGETRANGASSGLITFKHSQINTQNTNTNHQLSINISTSNPCPNVTNSSGSRQQENGEFQRDQSIQNSVMPNATNRQLPACNITGSHATLSNGVVISPPPYCDVINTSARLPSVVVSRPERPQARRILFSL